jgi:hypothetical protein
VHGLRGRRSNRALSEATRQRAVKLYETKYADHGPTLAAEFMSSEDGLAVCPETLRLWLIQAKRWHTRKSQPKHRRWRARKQHRGEMVQMDGWQHDWFEGRRPECVSMVMNDDASNWMYARFFEAETTAAAFETLKRYASLNGLPRRLYVDRASIYKTTRDASVEEELALQAALTQFGRGMKQLGVQLALANSPQAKGRVERRNGLLQDRLVKLMRLRGIDDIEAANELLDKEYLAELNERLCVPPAKPADVHRPIGQEVDLDRVLAFEETRRVGNDWTVRWRNRRFQLGGSQASRGLVGERVLVVE